MSVLLVAVLAGVAMALDDVFYAGVTLAEASGRGWLAGGLDALGWYSSITTTTLAVTTLHRGAFTLAGVMVLITVGAANVCGTRLGTETGKLLLRWLHADTIESLAERVGALEEDQRRHHPRWRRLGR